MRITSVLKVTMEVGLAIGGAIAAKAAKDDLVDTFAPKVQGLLKNIGKESEENEEVTIEEVQ